MIVVHQEIGEPYHTSWLNIPTIFPLKQWLLHKNKELQIFHDYMVEGVLLVTVDVKIVH